MSYGFSVGRVLVCHWDDVRSFIVPGYTVMVVLYSWSGVRGIPWSSFRVRALAHLTKLMTRPPLPLAPITLVHV